MENNDVKRYENIMRYFTKAYKSTNDSAFKSLSQDIVGHYVDSITELDPSKKDSYTSVLKEVGLFTVKTDIIKSDYKENNDGIVKQNDINKRTTFEQVKKEQSQGEYQACFDYIDNYIAKNTDAKNELCNLLNQLKTDMESPNDVLISTWVKNYKDFVRSYSLDEKMMCDYLKYIFVVKYENQISFDEIEKLYLDDNIIELDVKDDKKENELSDSNKNNSDIVKPSEDSNNEIIDDKEKDVSEKLTSMPIEPKVDITKSEDKKSEIGENVENPSHKVSENKDNKAKVDDKLSEKKSETLSNEEKPEALKIVNIEKPLKQGMNRFIMPLSIIALLFVGGTSLLPIALNSAFKWLLVTKGVDLIFKGINNFKYKQKLRKILDENGLDIIYEEGKKGGTLIDKKTKKEITVDIDKARYDNIKNALISIKAIESKPKTENDVSNPLIKGVYKVNSLTKNLVNRADKYFKKKKEQKQLIKAATSYEEKMRVNNSSLEFNDEINDYDIVYDNESKGRSL